MRSCTDKRWTSESQLNSSPQCEGWRYSGTWRSSCSGHEIQWCGSYQPESGHKNDSCFNEFMLHHSHQSQTLNLVGVKLEQYTTSLSVHFIRNTRLRHWFFKQFQFCDGRRGEPVSTEASDFRSTGVEPDAVFYCCNPTALRIHVLCIVRYLSAHYRCKERQVWAAVTWQLSSACVSDCRPPTHWMYLNLNDLICWLDKNMNIGGLLFPLKCLVKEYLTVKAAK